MECGRKYEAFCSIIVMAVVVFLHIFEVVNSEMSFFNFRFLNTLVLDDVIHTVIVVFP